MIKKVLTSLTGKIHLTVPGKNIRLGNVSNAEKDDEVTNLGQVKYLIKENANFQNVKWFGAKGDGITDDTSSIQKAINFVYNIGGGTVFCPKGNYLIKGSLISYQSVAIIGEGIESSNLSPRPVTLFTHKPNIPNTDFLTITLVPDGEVETGNYTFFTLKDFKVKGDYGVNGNSRDGIILDRPKALISNVFIHNFSGKAWRIQSSINTKFERCGGYGSDYGVYFEPTGMVSTSVTFSSCYFGGVNRVAAYVANCTAVAFTDYCIFESSLEEGLIADCSVSLINPYFENITKELIKAGTGGVQVGYISVKGGVYVGGGHNDPKTDVFYIDDVDFVDIDVQDIRIPKASVIRTTANTGGIIWRPPFHLVSVSATVRANLTVYTLGDKMQVVCNDNITRVFVCITAGTSAAAPPTFTRTSSAITDGTVIWKVMGVSVIVNHEFVIELDSSNNKGRLTAAQIATKYEDIIYRLAAGYHFVKGDLQLTRLGATNPILYSRPDLDHTSMNTKEVSTTHYLKVNEGIESYNPNGSAIEPLLTKQDHNSKGLIKYQATVDSTGVTTPITTWKTGATLVGYVKVNVAGTDYWMPYYTAPTGA